MSLSDEDKKYIQDAIKQNTESVAKQSSKTEKQLSEQKKYITELRDRQKEGTLTLAQSVELLKNDLHETIEQNKALKLGQEALTRTVEAGKEVGKGGMTSVKGAGQMTSGLATLLLKSNPLTGMLVKDKTALGAVGDIGSGFGNIFKGIGQGAVGGIKALLGMKQETKKATKPKDGPDVVINTLTASKIIQEKEESKQEVEQQDMSSPMMKVLKAGFGGMQSSLDLANNLTKQVIKNQKQVLTGLLLGVAGIAALVWAWKNTPLGDMIKDGCLKALSEWFNKPKKKAQNATDNAINATNNSNINVPAKLDAFKSNGETSYIDMIPLNKDGGKLADRESVDNAYKSGQINDATYNTIMNSPSAWTETLPELKQFKHTGTCYRLGFPVSLKIIKVEFSRNKNVGATVTIERINKEQKGIKEKIAARTLIITNVLDILVPKNYEIKPGTPIVEVGSNYEIIGNIAAFMNGENFVDYQNKNNSDPTQFNKTYKEQYNDQKFQKALVKSEKDYFDSPFGLNWRQSFAEQHPGVAKAREELSKAFGYNQDKGDETYSQQHQNNAETPEVTKSYVEQEQGEKVSKIDEQANKLNKKQEKEEPTIVGNAQPTTKEENKIIAMAPQQDSIGDSYANIMSPQKIIDASPDYVDVQAIG